MPSNPSIGVAARAATCHTGTLKEIVDCLARQIDDGSLPIVQDMEIECPGIDCHELQRLAALCDARRLPLQAARIRRWCGPS